MKSIWSWRKLDSSGSILVRGTDHGSMVDCLRAAREYRGASVSVPIAIELQVVDARDAAGVVYLGNADDEPGRYMVAKRVAVPEPGEPPARSTSPVAARRVTDDAILHERETRYIRREEEARSRAARTDDIALRHEFLQSARVYAELIGSIRRERGVSAD